MAVARRAPWSSCPVQTGTGMNVNHHFDWVILIWMLALVSFIAVMYIGQWVSNKRQEYKDRHKRERRDGEGK
jgi:hypothetical protein